MAGVRRELVRRSDGRGGGRALRCGAEHQLSLALPFFLRAKTSGSETRGGIVEADETCFRLSFKGSRRWRDGLREGRRDGGSSPPDRPPKTRGTRAQKRGLSHEQVAVLISRDRSGATRACMLQDRSADALDTAIGPVLPKDGILCSDKWRALGVVAPNYGIRHEPINLFAGEPVREKTWHIQNANARHGRLKGWVRAFCGVATRYLPNELAWHHGCERHQGKIDHASWLRLALNS